MYHDLSFPALPVPSSIVTGTHAVNKDRGKKGKEGKNEGKIYRSYQ